VNVEGILRAKGGSVETVSPNAGMVLAVHKLATLRIGALVVVEGDRVKGTIAERDIVRSLNRDGVRALEMRVKDVMVGNPPVCSPTDSLRIVMAEMTRTRHRHLPVVNENGELCGLISIGDVVKHRLEEMELEAAVLRDAYLARH
jgi:CBS domain-containing protein